MRNVNFTRGAMGIAHCVTRTLLPTQDVMMAGVSGMMRTSATRTMRTRMERSLTTEYGHEKDFVSKKNEVDDEELKKNK